MRNEEVVSDIFLLALLKVRGLKPVLEEVNHNRYYATFPIADVREAKVLRSDPAFKALSDAIIEVQQRIRDFKNFNRV